MAKFNRWAKQHVRQWLGLPDQRIKPETEKKTRRAWSALADTAEPDEDIQALTERMFKVAQPLPGVGPTTRMAMDDAFSAAASYMVANAAFAEGVTFMGYPYLSELTQRAEYRRPVEILAREMTKKWITVKATGDDNKDDKIRQIEAEMKRLNMRDVYCNALEQDGFFGASRVYIDVGIEMDNKLEQLSPLVANKAKLRKDGIKRLQVVEPIWTYPGLYNSINPMDRGFYKPDTWYVMASEVHSSRLLSFISRPVPDILKPAYVFGGISLSQMMKPYVDNWLRTRQSVSDLLSSFSVFGLKTDMSQILENAGAADLLARAKLFNQTRNNRGLNMIDKDSEDFFNIAVPLGTLDKLQAQAQEHMAAVPGIPLVIMFGLSPSGLNATGDSEIRSFEDWIAGSQESIMGSNVTRTLNLIQVSLFGEVDPEIGYEWNSLWSMNEEELATTRKTEAETGAILIGQGVIDTKEERARIAQQKESQYAGLDLNKDITSPEQQAQQSQMAMGLQQMGKPGEGGDDQDKGGGGGPGGARVVGDAWEESQHPRGQPDNAGEFASEGGGGGKATKSEAQGGMVAAPADKESWPDHIKGIAIPPAWTDVRFNADPEADLLAVGRDKKGRRQAIYSDKHNAAQAAAKYSRLKELISKFGDIETLNQRNRGSSDAAVRELADCMALIMRMGVRPGSNADRGGDVKAYGASTLEGKHVKALKSGLRLRFIGKKGVSLDLPVKDPEVAAMLTQRAARAGSYGKLFPNVTDAKLSAYTKEIAGENFHTKDFRTLIGTQTALDAVAKMPAPANQKEYKKAVRTVAQQVSERLGNTPTIALQSYIAPVVFADWRVGAEQGGTGQSPAQHLRELFKRVSKADGGFTYQPVTDKEPTKGFALSVYPERSYAESIDQLKFADLVQYAKKNKDLFTNPENYIGAWHDPESHKVFFDVSVVKDKEDEAAALARQKDQIAYFDLAKMQSVTVNKNATSGGAALQ